MLNQFSEECKCDSYGHFTIENILIGELRRQNSVPIKIYSTSKIPKKHDLVIVFYIPKTLD